MATLDPEGYTPEPITISTLAELGRYVAQEYLRISATFDRGLARRVEFLNAQPTRRFEGMTVGADGTNWNPGAGKGVYTYYSGVWNKLG